MIDRAWRVVRTGLAFAFFGLAGLVLAGVVLPVVRRRPGTLQQREIRSQYMVHRTFRIFVQFMLALRLFDLEVRGAELLRQPGQLVVANHPTLLDVVFLVSLMPQADCVVKRATFANPFMRGVVRGTGYLSNDLGEGLIDACADRLEAGRSVLLFPEGTRPLGGALGPFQRGAAHVALKSGRPLRPVWITCDPPTLMRGQNWYDVPERRIHYTFECCEGIDPADLAGPGESRGAAARKISAALRDFFTKKQQTLSI